MPDSPVFLTVIFPSDRTLQHLQVLHVFLSLMIRRALILVVFAGIRIIKTRQRTICSWQLHSAQTKQVSDVFAALRHQLEAAFQIRINAYLLFTGAALLCTCSPCPDLIFISLKPSGITLCQAPGIPAMLLCSSHNIKRFWTFSPIMTVKSPKAAHMSHVQQG